MLSSFEVGVSFVLRDAASPTLRSLTDQVNVLNRSILPAGRRLAELGKGQPLDALTKEVGTLAGALDALDKTVDGTGGRLDAMASEGVAALGQMRAAAGETAAALDRLKIPGALPSSSTSASLRETNTSGPRARQPGGSHVPVDLLGLAITAGTYEAMRTGADAQQDWSLAVSSLGADPAGPRGTALLNSFHATALRSAAGTMFSEREVSAVLPPFVQVASSGWEGTPEQKAAEAGTVFPLALRMAEMAQRNKLGDLESNVKAGATYAHLTRRYDPAGLKTGMDNLLAAAEMTHTSPDALVNIMKYNMPVGNLAGADPDKMTAATTFLLQSLGSTTTAGTALGQVVLGTLKGGGALSGHLDTLRSGLERTLKMEPEAAAAIGNRNRHEQALRDMGIHAAGHLTVLDQAGNLDIDKELNLVAKFAADNANNKEKVADALLYGFGVRGERGLAAFATPEGLAQWFRVEKLLPQMAAGLGGKGIAQTQQDQLAGTPLGEFQQVTARLSDVIVEAVQSPLLLLGGAAQGAADALGALAGAMNAHPALAGAAGDTALGLIGGAAAGAIAGSILPGPGTVAGGLLGAVLGSIGGGMVGANLAPQPAGTIGVLGDPQDLDHPYQLPAPAPASGGLIHQEAYHPGEGGVNVGVINVYGAPHDSDETWARRITQAIAAQLDRALMLNSGAGWGSHSSAYQNAIGDA